MNLMIVLALEPSNASPSPTPSMMPGSFMSFALAPAIALVLIGVVGYFKLRHQSWPSSGDVIEAGSQKGAGRGIVLTQTRWAVLCGSLAAGALVLGLIL